MTELMDPPPASGTTTPILRLPRLVHWVAEVDAPAAWPLPDAVPAPATTAPGVAPAAVAVAGVPAPPGAAPAAAVARVVLVAAAAWAGADEDAPPGPVPAAPLAAEDPGIPVTDTEEAECPDGTAVHTTRARSTATERAPETFWAADARLSQMRN